MEPIIKVAKFSECRKYRYMLSRIWDHDKPQIAFIGLNPSNANESNDDPTIRKVIKFGKDWGYGGIHMYNLFAFVTAYPRVLKDCGNPIGDNDQWLLKLKHYWRFEVVFAWGNFDVFGRDKEVISMFPNAKCLGKNKNGSPKHPLYIPAQTKLVPFN